uniref:KTSC domain-containing protein n=1 Tax=Heterorhabditis bacteriophora TaxID=37862 RepID=A0A1I7X6A2_HETBA
MSSSRQLFRDSITVELFRQTNDSVDERKGSSRSNVAYFSLCKTEVNFTIVERLYRKTVKEFLFEISRPNEFGFVFTRGITQEKYQIRNNVQI